MTLDQLNARVESALKSAEASSFALPIQPLKEKPETYSIQIELKTNGHAASEEEVERRKKLALDALSALGITEKLFVDSPSVRVMRGCSWHSVSIFLKKDLLDELLHSQIPST